MNVHARDARNHDMGHDSHQNRDDQTAHDNQLWRRAGQGHKVKQNEHQRGEHRPSPFAGAKNARFAAIGRYWRGPAQRRLNSVPATKLPVLLKVQLLIVRE